MIRKLTLLVALATLVPGQAYAFIDGAARGGTSCGGCHGSTASAAVTTTISGPLTMLPGETQNFTASITPLGGYAGGALDIVLAGLAGATLGDIETNTQIINDPTRGGDNLTHTDAGSSPPTGNIGDWSYDFAVTAPLSLGAVVINAVMMAFNGDLDNSDADLWNPVQFSVEVVPELSTVVLLGSGIAGLAAVGRRRTSHSES